MFVIDDITNFATTLVNKIFPDKTQAEKDQAALQITLATQEFQLTQGQLDINKAEASNPNIFVSGWRPWIGWGLGTIVIFYSFLTLLVNFMVSFHFDVNPFPPLDPMVRDIILGLLGLHIAGRTYEKVKGVS